MSRKNIKLENLNDDYQYYSARLIDLNEVLSDTNRELTGVGEEIQLNRHRNQRKQKKMRDYFKDYDARSSLSDDEEYTEIRPRLKMSQKRSRSMKCSLDNSIHDLHRKVRDISFEQEKLADKIQMERCKCGSSCSRKSCPRIKKSSSEMDTSFENRLENRIEQVYNKIKKKHEQKSINEELKSVIEDFKKTTASIVKDDLHKNQTSTQANYVEADLEKHKTQNELIMTKQKIADLEDSKNMLSQQVQRLKEQLEKFESSQLHPQDTSKMIPLQIHQTITKELESFREKLEKSANHQKPSDSNEIISVVAMYKNEIEKLNDSIQNLKITLKDKEINEKELKSNIKSLTDKNNDLEKLNQTMRNDLEMALQKINELAYEQNQSINQLRLYEDELGMSEKKREELKLDATETIKLWKNKVKKLEKNLEKTRVEVENLSQQNEYLKEASKNLTSQLENLSQEYHILRDINKSLEIKLSSQGNEINQTKNTFEDLKHENYSLKTEISGSQNSVRTVELKNQELMIENSRLEQKLKSEETKQNEFQQKLNKLQHELEELKGEKRKTQAHLHKLENENQNLKASLSTLERSEEMTKTDLTNISKQALQNKETYEEALSKCSSQLQMTHCQYQKMKLEFEEKVRSLQVQLAEEKSNIEILKKRESDYNSEIDEQKSLRQKIESDLSSLQSRLEKFVRSDTEKTKILSEYEDKYTRLIDELTYQKNNFYNKETEYIKILNLIEVDLDMLIGVISVNINKTYQPLLNLEESDKVNLAYLLIKHKSHWIGKNLEEIFQQKIKFQQNVVFLEHEVDALKKNSANNLKAQGLYLKNLENQNSELLADRAIALKNMELLEQYLHNLSESVKNHSMKEIERTHHLLAIDNFQTLCNSNTLSEAEKEEIYQRFKKYKSTIDDIKSQLDVAQMNCCVEPYDRVKEKVPVRNSSSCSSQRSSSHSHYACKKAQNQKQQQPAKKPVPFR